MKKTLLLSASLVALTLGFSSASFAEDTAFTPRVASEEIMVKELTLKDGTKVLVKGEEVFVVGTDGIETAAPDGTHMLEDDTTVTTQDGKIFHPEAPASEEPATSAE